MSTIASVVNLV